MTTAAELTQPDVARLMGLLTSSTVKALIREIANEVREGRITWAPFRGQADTFGASLAQQLRNNGRLSAAQINAAKGRLLQLNWTQVVHVLSRGLVTVPGVTLESATDTARPAPTYTARRGAGTAPATSPTRASRARRTRTPAPAPAPAPAPVQTRVCNKLLAYSQLRCTRPSGHPYACIGERAQAPAAPTNDVDSALAGLRTAPGAGGSRGAGAQFLDEDDARAARLALVVEAAWDDDGPAVRDEPETDPSIERFKLLDLD